MNFAFDTQAFIQTLPIMGKGMLGIFAVTVVIIGCILILNKVTKA